jgi:YebC/PmpR family DNA-binding regulatory protein
MSGHNKWTQIKRQKGTNDAKRSKIFTKLGKVITMAAKNGGEPETNPVLKIAVEKARAVNMPSDNIKKAIKKGTGELEGGNIEEVLYEAYGPEGVALIIEATTDNNNRTVSEVKHLLSVHGGRLGEGGSVKWMFDRFGYMEITRNDNINIEEVEMQAIDAGAEDVSVSDEMIVVYVKPEDMYRVKSELEKNKLSIFESGFEWKAKNKVKVDADLSAKIEVLFEALDEQEDVNEVYSNIE